MLRNALLTVVLSFLAAASASAQTVRGTILGTVTDSSGAVIVKARVTVKEFATGLTRSELTNDEGEYSIPQLPVGIYTLTVEAPNFKKASGLASNCVSMIDCASIFRSPWGRSARWLRLKPLRL